ncbi:MAG TPA: hypothetical protein VMQ73_12350, partial [Methylomirabilota bacterium]|nr:hypothetical protein [Methylomirabilota bacterium]
MDSSGERQGSATEDRSQQPAEATPPPPIQRSPSLLQRFRGLNPIDRFTFFIALFTLCLVIVSGLQYVAFVSSERADLVVEDVQFFYGEPSTQQDGMGVFLIIKNVGRHTAHVTELNVSPGLMVTTSELPDNPRYQEKPAVPVIA